jgi:putative flippase GtrA
LIRVQHQGGPFGVEAVQRRARGRHRKPSLISHLVSEHARRLTSFSLIGFGVFVLGICFQALLVRVMYVPAVSAYVIQVVVSVQANFVANVRWTWSDRKAPFWRACRRYNVKRAAGTALSLALYPLLIRLGMNYLIANGVIVVLLTPANYALGHWWTFAARDRRLPGIKANEADSEGRRSSRRPARRRLRSADAGAPIQSAA